MSVGGCDGLWLTYGRVTLGRPEWKYNVLRLHGFRSTHGHAAVADLSDSGDGTLQRTGADCKRDGGSKDVGEGCLSGLRVSTSGEHYLQLQVPSMTGREAEGRGDAGLHANGWHRVSIEWRPPLVALSITLAGGAYARVTDTAADTSKRELEFVGPAVGEPTPLSVRDNAGVETSAEFLTGYATTADYLAAFSLLPELLRVFFWQQMAS